MHLSPAADTVFEMEFERLSVEALPELPAPNKEWLVLGHAAGNPFTTWEWASAWWREFGEERRQLILGCRDESGELIGLLPLFAASERPARVLRFVGHGAADQLGPVCRPEHREAVAAAFLGALRERRDWDICMAERLATVEAWPELIGGTVTRSERSPTIHVKTTDWTEFLSNYSSNFRGQVRNFENRLAKKHELAFRRSEDPERLDDDLDVFFRLHEQRWENGAGGSTVFSSGLEQFHRGFAHEALRRGWLRLSFLELDGEPVASAYVFRLGGADWLYQQGWDPSLAKQRVGRVMLNRTIRDAVEDGMSEYKFLLGEEEYKDRYTDEDAPVTTVAIGRNAVFRSAVGAAVPLKRMVANARDAARRTLARGTPAFPVLDEMLAGGVFAPAGI